MIILSPQARQRWKCQGNRQYFDGGGIGNSGPSTTETKTESNDMRVVGAEGSVNTSTKIDISGANANLTTSDYGAVAGGLQLALKGIEANSQLTRDIVTSNGSLIDGVMNRTSQAGAQFATALENVKTSDVRTLMFTGLAVVAVVAVMAFKKG